jgi:hypothetical protein
MGMMKHVIEIERDSACGTWVERFLVEINAATVADAKALVAFSLDAAERIVHRVELRLVSVAT